MIRKQLESAHQHFNSNGELRKGEKVIVALTGGKHEDPEGCARVSSAAGAAGGESARGAGESGSAGALGKSWTAVPEGAPVPQSGFT